MRKLHSKLSMKEDPNRTCSPPKTPAVTISHGMAAVTAPTPPVQVASPAVQKFRLTPHDLQILEGTDTLLRCEVSNRAGKVQWTKDGFALGFSAVIPGFPRYSVLVDAKQNAYNLQIKNATLEDDAEYQCQVGPAAGNPAIRANAKLSIVAAPSSIVIEGYARNARVEVEERQNLTLHCIAENANPAAEIVWFQGEVPVATAPIVSVNQTAPKRFTTSSTLHLQPRAEDDYKEFSCEARHKALPPDVPMRAQVQLSVLYPPGAPFFEGYRQGESLHRGQEVQIACRSRGGNPPAQLTWYRNGVAISSPQRTSGRLSENVYKFTAAAEDNGANLVCEAKNLLATTPLRAELNLTVLYAPKDVYLSGANQAKVGDSVQLSCVTAPSNPQARISWSINGRPLENSTYKTTSSSDGGWVSSSNISLTIDSQSRTFIAVCHALNTELTQNVVGSHTVNVLYPPSPPLLTGYNDGDILISGSILKLQCSSAGGNPPPTLQWYKNDKIINAPSKLVDSKITSEMSLLVNASDNNAIYKCKVQNAAIDIPLFATKTLGVHFPPETVKISVVPKNLVPGIRAKLVCDSSSSNPPAKISWWKDGIPVEGLNLANRPGLWGGSVSTLEMYVNITQDLDGIIYTCQSHNEVLQRSVHETISLDILYPPKFETSQSNTFVGVEGAPFHVELMASGNPMVISYTWTKDGLPISSNSLSGQRLISDGPRLNISRLSRNDAGVYMCEALNSQGTALLEVHVAVEYAPTITAVSEGRSFVAGEPAVLACHIQARPLEAAHVRWSRDGYDLASRTISSFENGTALLQIASVERSDIGNFTCIVDNQRGAPAAQNVLLVVQTAPEIDHSPGYTRYAARLGVRAQLICRSLASPQPSFIWRRHGKDLKMQRRNKFKSVERQVDTLNYESALLIENTSADDYGQYECVVRNALGQASTTLEFSKPSRPDAPLQLRVGNVSDTGVELNWTPGFDGGMQTYFRLRLKQHGEDKYKYVDAKPGHQNISLDGLKPGATYYFSVMAANEAGGSKFMPDIKLTLSKGSQPHSAEYTEKDELPNVMIIGITSAAMVLLVLNAALVAWFVIRRQNKSQSEAEPSNDDVYSKDDSQSVYKADVQKKAAASTYLVENVDIIQSTAYPPKYQESSMCTPPYPLCNPDFTRTLPNPKRHSQRNSATGMIEGMQMRSKDDHMLISNGLYIPSPSPASSLVIKGSYISSPSPAPPADGSYFNMSDKYMSYPPVTY
ncbi:nephrin isoform X2 [Drosophila subpulchrella]|uniref:nephrin isoform X2 n=1 Tax=Drosophila subpulchrella TaxID=1486046 RepID=UPI0018A16608|nr:nephrin isoform X2 [Drosophila subpulchrella]